MENNQTFAEKLETRMKSAVYRDADDIDVATVFAALYAACAMIDSPKDPYVLMDEILEDAYMAMKE